MEKQLSAEGAWVDFFDWVRQSESWAGLSRAEKQYLYKAEKARRDGGLGYDRIKRLLTTHAPDRYRFEERVIIIEE